MKEKRICILKPNFSFIMDESLEDIKEFYNYKEIKNYLDIYFPKTNYDSFMYFDKNNDWKETDIYQIEDDEKELNKENYQKNNDFKELNKENNKKNILKRFFQRVFKS